MCFSLLIGNNCPNNNRYSFINTFVYKCIVWKTCFYSNKNINVEFFYKSKTALLRNGETQKGNGYPEANDYSARILETMQTGVIFFNTEQIISGINNLACEDLQIPRDPSGHKITDIISIIHQEKDIFPELIARLKSSETDMEKLPIDTLIRSLETKVQFFASGCIMQLETGRYLLAFRNTMDEVTHEHLLSMILARTKIFPWFFDLKRNKMLIDAHWFSYLGIPAGDCEITIEKFFSRVHPNERDMLADALQKQLSEKEIPDSFSYRLQRGDGSWEWFSEQSMYLSKTNDGSPYRIVGVCHSIQEHKNTEDKLRAARNKAQESDRLKSAFLANMSHEIRTPLNAIVGFSNLIAGGIVDLDTEEARDYSALISKNCNYLLTLVSDVLDLSCIESDTMTFKFTIYPLTRLLTEIYQKYENRIPQEVQFNLLLPTDNVEIETDAVRLRQVIEHLLDNAAKFTVKGHIDIGYALSDHGEKIYVFVADTGCGIPSDQYKKVFERFYKINSFVQGAGLGLSVCKTIVEGLGGTINVYSQLKEGSRFSVILPLNRLHK